MAQPILAPTTLKEDTEQLLVVAELLTYIRPPFKRTGDATLYNMLVHRERMLRFEMAKKAGWS